MVRIDVGALDGEMTCGTGYLIGPGIVAVANQVISDGRPSSESSTQINTADLMLRPFGGDSRSYRVLEIVALREAPISLLVAPNLQLPERSGPIPAAHSVGTREWLACGFPRSQQPGRISKLKKYSSDAGGDDEDGHRVLLGEIAEAASWTLKCGAVLFDPDDAFYGILVDRQGLKSGHFELAPVHLLRDAARRVQDSEAQIFDADWVQGTPARLYGSNVAHFLDPAKQIVDFVNSQPFSEARETIVEWAKADLGQRLSVAVLTAPGGWGKSRLAARVCSDLIADGTGWSAGFADISRLETYRIPEDKLLLVIDEAEQHVQAIDDFLAKVSDGSEASVRLLLLTRNKNDALDAALKRSADQLMASVTTVRLPPDEFSYHERRDHAHAAYTAFAKGLKSPSGSSPPSVSVPRQVLDHAATQSVPASVHLYALLAAIEAAQRDRDQLYYAERFRADRDALLAGRVADECRRLDLASIDTRFSDADAAEVLAVVALVRPTRDHLVALLPLCPRLVDGKADFHPAVATAIWSQHGDAGDSSSRVDALVRPIAPDLVIAYLLHTTVDLRVIVERLLDHALLARHPRYLVHVLRVLIDGAAVYDDLSRVLRRVLPSALSILITEQRTVAPELMELLRTHLPSLVAAAIDTTDNEQPIAASQLSTVVAHGECLEDASVAAAAAATLTDVWPTLEAPGLAELGLVLAGAARRHWVRAGSEEFDAPAHLARLRRMEGQWLIDVGRHQAALEAAEDAVQQYKTLIEQGLHVYRPDFALALQGFADRLGAAGMSEGAAAVLQQRVEVYEDLAEVDQARWLPFLVTALKQLASKLDAVGRQEQASAALNRSLALRQEQEVDETVEDGGGTNAEIPAGRGPQIPEVVYQRIAHAAATRARVLNLSGLHLTSLPDEIEQLTYLEVLDLSFNRITELPQSLAQLRSLREINLSENQMTVMPEVITGLTWLRDLYLHQNRLSTLPASIGNMTDLMVLFLDNNELTELPEALGELPSLTELYVRFNRLTELPGGIGLRNSLEELQLDGNPLGPELKAAARLGIDAVQSLLARIDDEGVLIREGKIVLVGEGEVGKTSLLAALRNEPFVVGRDTTHGIEVKPLILSSEDRGVGAEIKLNAWDFGGQEVYRPTHQLFFTAPAVYLVVWKPRQGPELGFVDYWIDLIRRRTTGADVIIHIVATHHDDDGRLAHLPVGRLREKYGDLIAGVHHVDSATGSGIAELRTAITNSAGRLPNLVRRLPSSWLRFQEHLKASGIPYLSHQEYLREAAAYGLDGESAEMLAMVATELGYWCYYPSFEGLDQLVVLKADWLSTAVSFVLEDEETNERHGLINHERLTHLWDDPARHEHQRYDPSIHSVLLRLMEKYEISYRISRLGPEQADTSLIAQLVNEDAPNLTDWEGYGRELPEQTRVCRFLDGDESVIPDGLMYILIVRMHRFSLGRENYARSVHWRHGLVLDRGVYGRALIRIERNQLVVSVRAAYPYFFLNQLTADICDYVKDFWPGLDSRTYVTCDTLCADPYRSKRGTFEVGRLRRNQQRNRKVAECNACEEELPIGALIDGVELASPSSKELQRVIEFASFRLDRIDQEVRAQGESTRQAVYATSASVQSRLEEQLQQIMRALGDQAVNGPRLITVARLHRRRRLLPTAHYRLRITLWCEFTRLPLSVLDRDPTSGVYDIDVPREWLVRAAPWLKTCARLLQSIVPIAAGVVELGLDKTQLAEIEKELKFTQTVLDKFATNAQDLTEGVDAEGQRLWIQDSWVPKGADLRLLHKLLRERDLTYGGLERVLDGGRFLWVHPNAKAQLAPGHLELGQRKIERLQVPGTELTQPPWATR
jgi:hypothetical protein